MPARPTTEWASTRPGVTTFAVSTRKPAGTDTCEAGPTRSIFPSRTSTTPSRMGGAGHGVDRLAADGELGVERGGGERGRQQGGEGREAAHRWSSSPSWACIRAPR